MCRHNVRINAEWWKRQIDAYTCPSPENRTPSLCSIHFKSFAIHGTISTLLQTSSVQPWIECHRLLPLPPRCSQWAGQLWLLTSSSLSEVHETEMVCLCLYSSHCHIPIMCEQFILLQLSSQFSLDFFLERAMRLRRIRASLHGIAQNLSKCGIRGQT
jgi:hypothetical protein